MNFTYFDAVMRSFENRGSVVLHGMYIVARLDGRKFTKLTKRYNYTKPYDESFRYLMIETTKHLMDCGFKVIYGYTQSDEISLLLDTNIDTFNRKERKFNSVLAGEASAKFSLLIGDLATFDCRLSTLPNIDRVIDYFRWRSADANRNCINSYCHYTLLDGGKTPRVAAKELNGKSTSWKNEFLFKRGINYNEISSWKKRGVGLYYENYDKVGYNPKTKEKVSVKRTILKVDLDLPAKESYANCVRGLATYGTFPKTKKLCDVFWSPDCLSCCDLDKCGGIL